jgi:allantoicase
MDGWESRRHNRAALDYAIIKLGVASGIVEGVEIDTTFFRGNEAPEVSVEGCFSSDDSEVVSWGGGRGGWTAILSKEPCGPSQRHAWKIPPNGKSYTHVRLNMYPDGGIARFRLFGSVLPILPEDKTAIFDLAAMQNGGTAVSWSDQEFDTRASNLLLPGRGPDMSDGWETSRARTEDHVDWVIVKLGVPGKIHHLILDTAHFRGNFPQQAEVLAINFEGGVEPDVSDQSWQEVTELVDCGPDEEKMLQSLNCEQVFTHVKLNIYPDGGVKRLRVFGAQSGGDRAVHKSGPCLWHGPRVGVGTSCNSCDCEDTPSHL